MKEIRITRLTLRDFKGLTFDLAAGSNVDVFGANATGKTTLADGFAWLLFDKDSLGRSDFEIKNLDAQGEAEHGLEHSVEGALEANGTTTVLRKSYHEIWTKKRGSAQALLTGNTTDYFIDGVPVQKQHYVTRITELVGDEVVFRLLTTPIAFPALHWTKQRALLLEMCGDLTDDQVIQSDPGLAALTEILGNRKLEDHKKVIAARRQEINKELDKIPVRIDEVKRGLPDIQGLDRNELSGKIGQLEGQINDAKLRLQGVDNGAGMAELSKKIQGLKYDISQLENQYYLEGMRHVTQMNARINELTAGKQDRETRTHNLKFSIENNQKRITGLEAQLQSLREKWTAIDAETFDPDKVVVL